MQRFYRGFRPSTKLYVRLFGSADHSGTDHGRLFINEARTGVMAWWSMGRWTDRAAREAIIAHAMTMTLADFRRWFARHAASCLVD